MEHSIALVTGTTSGLGYAAASMLATKGYRQVIVTGAAWPGSRKRPLNSRLKPRPRSSRPLELDLDTPSSVQSALAALARCRDWSR